MNDPWRAKTKSIHSHNICSLVEEHERGVSICGHYVSMMDWNGVERGNFLHALRQFTAELLENRDDG